MYITLRQGDHPWFTQWRESRRPQTHKRHVCSSAVALSPPGKPIDLLRLLRAIQCSLKSRRPRASHDTRSSLHLKCRGRFDATGDMAKQQPPTQALKQRRLQEPVDRDDQISPSPD
jgi:hypothetical protein